MIELYDVVRDRVYWINVDGLEYPIRTTESYSDVKNKVEGVTNVR